MVERIAQPLIREQRLETVSHDLTEKSGERAVVYRYFWEWLRYSRARKVICHD